MSERDPLAPAFEIPDLELEPAVSKRPAPVSVGRSPAASSPKPAFGIDLPSDDDDFELISLGSNVELSVGTSPQATARHVETVGWPHGRTRGIDQLPIDAAEVAIVADYGPAPKNAILAPLYAQRVFKRRAPLKKAVAQYHTDLAAAEVARDTELMELSTDLRPQLEASDVFRRLLEPMREIERLAGDRTAALSAADSGYREQMARFDAELLLLRESEAQARAVAEQKSALKDAAENELRRAEAKQQRVQIEMRGAMDVARKAVGPSGGDIPQPQAAQLAELQVREKALQPELSQAKTHHATAKADLDQADAEARGLQTRIRKLERQKNDAGAALGKQLSERAAGVSEAEKQRRDAMADVARAVLAARGSIGVPEATIAALRQHDKTVEALAVRLETHVRALDSYDRERVKQGVIVVLSAVGIVLLSILLKAML